MSVSADRNEESRRLATKHAAPVWLPISILVGTCFAVGIPILMFRNARATAFRASIDKPSAAPPRRRHVPSVPVLASRKPSASGRFRPTATTPSKSSPSHLDDDAVSPSLLTALSKSTTSNALFAGKAFLIATTLVGIGAFGLVSTAQHLTGAYTVPEFARRMRYWTDRHMKPLTDRIYKSEREGAEEDDLDWTWEEAEERMKKAYEQGGFTLWAQMALRELEIEARVERTRRRREILVEHERSGSS